jgi:hypothetical protein
LRPGNIYLRRKRGQKSANMNVTAFKGGFCMTHEVKVLGPKLDIFSMGNEKRTMCSFLINFRALSNYVL